MSNLKLLSDSLTFQSQASVIAAILAGSPAALNTFKEFADALGDDPNFATTFATALANRLRIDMATQGLSPTQQLNARTNISAVAVADVPALLNKPVTNIVYDSESRVTNYTEAGIAYTVTYDSQGRPLSVLPS